MGFWISCCNGLGSAGLTPRAPPPHPVYGGSDKDYFHSRSPGQYDDEVQMYLLCHPSHKLIEFLLLSTRQVRGKIDKEAIATAFPVSGLKHVFRSLGVLLNEDQSKAVHVNSLCI